MRWKDERGWRLFTCLPRRGRVIRIHSRKLRARRQPSSRKLESDLKIEILMRWVLVIWH
jgi:hypothetical protein